MARFERCMGLTSPKRCQPGFPAQSNFSCASSSAVSSSDEIYRVQLEMQPLCHYVSHFFLYVIVTLYEKRCCDIGAFWFGIGDRDHDRRGDWTRLRQTTIVEEPPGADLATVISNICVSLRAFPREGFLCGMSTVQSKTIPKWQSPGQKTLKRRTSPGKSENLLAKGGVQ